MRTLALALTIALAACSSEPESPPVTIPPCIGNCCPSDKAHQECAADEWRPITFRCVEPVSDGGTAKRAAPTANEEGKTILDYFPEKCLNVLEQPPLAIDTSLVVCCNRTLSDAK